MRFIGYCILVLLWAHIFNYFFVANLSGYEKFHIMISPESNYFPTIDETIKALDISKNSGKKFIVIGGSSASAGIGQSYSKIWSKFLAKNLGPEYIVFNSAMNGGGGYEFGYLQAKYLAEKGEKVLYVFDSPPLATGKSDGRWAYIYWNACLRGYEKDIKGCFDHAVQLWSKGRKSEVLKYFFDAVIPNQNFWNYVSYNFFQFQYHRFLTLDKNISSRNKYGVIEKDFHAEIPCFKNINEETSKRELGYVKGYKSFCYNKDGFCNEKEVAMALDRVFANYPHELKNRTINTMSQSNSYFHEMLDPSDQALIDQAWEIGSRLRDNYGIYGLVEPGFEWEKCDHVDRSHWSDLGAEKHSKHVENMIRKINF
jgi:hypothetical protein